VVSRFSLENKSGKFANTVVALSAIGLGLVRISLIGGRFFRREEDFFAKSPANSLLFR